MPGRKVPLVTGEIYHVFNRGIDHKPTHTSLKEYKRVLELLAYYRYQSPPLRFSRYKYLSFDRQHEILQAMKEKNVKLVEMLAFSLMPNHFHFLLKQTKDNGISRFMSQFQNSYTRYFNTIRQRVGSLYLDQFKAVRIENDEQFIHVSRYIHLNELTGFVVKDFQALCNSPWSSLPEYLGAENENGICSVDEVLAFFSNKDAYRTFVSNQADYQRTLKMIEHLTFE